MAALILLNYKRSLNVKYRILRQLLMSNSISIVVVAHGLPDAVFGVSKSLADGDSVLTGKVLHVGDYLNNERYRCWRRWLLLKRLVDEGKITSEYCIVLDDDLAITPSQISELLTKAKTLPDGWLTSIVDGRSFQERTYLTTSVVGEAPILVGRNICGKTRDFCDAVDLAQTLQIPLDVLQQDDICISMLVKCLYKRTIQDPHYALGLPVNKLPDPFALCKEKDHYLKRDATVSWWVEHSKRLDKVSQSSTSLDTTN